MKIKKKAKLPRLECKLCGCIFVPSKDDLNTMWRNKSCFADEEKIRDDVYADCPTCGLSKLVFKKGE